MKVSEVLKEVDLFTDLSPDELEQVAALGKPRESAEQAEIFREGDPGDELFVLLEGRVVIEIRLKLESEKAAVYTVSEGQVFGEIALVDGGGRSASATAIRKSKLVAISRPDLDGLMDRNPRIGYVIMRNFSRILCGRIRKSTKELRSSLMFD